MQCEKDKRKPGNPDTRKAWRAANRDKVQAGKVAYRQRRAERLAPVRAARREAKRLEIETRRAAREMAQRLARKAKRRAPCVVRELDPVTESIDTIGRASSSYRRCKGQTVTYPLTPEQLDNLLFLQGERCAYCGSPDSLHLDHKRAISKGGVHHISNVQFLCRFHNLDKWTTHDAAYRKAHGIPLRTKWDA